MIIDTDVTLSNSVISSDRGKVSLSWGPVSHNWLGLGLQSLSGVLRAVLRAVKWVGSGVHGWVVLHIWLDNSALDSDNSLRGGGVLSEGEFSKLAVDAPNVSSVSEVDVVLDFEDLLDSSGHSSSAFPSQTTGDEREEDPEDEESATRSVVGKGEG